jgi:toxin ParE1/3/4
MISIRFGATSLKNNPEAADRVLEAAWQICGRLAAQPELGRLRRSSKKELVDIRSFVIPDFPNYIIFYRVAIEGVQIVRVLHGAREIAGFFQGI